MDAASGRRPVGDVQRDQPQQEERHAEPEDGRGTRPHAAARRERRRPRRGQPAWRDGSPRPGLAGSAGEKCAPCDVLHHGLRSGRSVCLAGRSPCYRVYECRGGGYYSVAALEPKFWTAVCGALARPDLADLQYSEDIDAQKQLEKVFATKTRDEWQDVLAGVDACCEPVLDLDEVAAHPQIAARGVLAPRTEPVPRLGEHSTEILAAAGVDAARLADLRKRGIT